jgi:hypothetical protein
MTKTERLRAVTWRHRMLQRAAEALEWSGL